MAERDYTNDYEDWLRNNPPEYQGEPENPANYYGPPPDPYVPPAPDPFRIIPPPNSGGGGGGGGMSEEEGRRYDAEHGLYGGYMTPNGWVSGSPRSSGGGGGGSWGGGGGVSRGYDMSGFSWPQFNAPSFAAPPAFSYGDFKAPDFGDVFKDSSYTGRRDEGLRAIEHGAAAKGLTRLPQTLKDLSSWNQDFASREYGNIFDRSANTWTMNRNNAADNYSKNYGISRDVFDRNYTGALDMFKYNQFEPARMNFDDMFRRYKAELDATTAIATRDWD